jgi:hypothetical protein
VIVIVFSVILFPRSRARNPDYLTNIRFGFMTLLGHASRRFRLWLLALCTLSILRLGTYQPFGRGMFVRTSGLVLVGRLAAKTGMV